jgi:hypothetical protein
MPDLLERDLPHLSRDKTAKLAMDMIALRDILPDEEIFLDYGDEWEAAWQEHVENWEPVAGAEDYISAGDMMNNDSLVLPTAFDLIEHPRTVETWCNSAFSGTVWKRPHEEGKLLDFIRNAQNPKGVSAWQRCDILDHRESNGEVIYTALVWVGNKKGRFNVMGNLLHIPRKAFKFTDTPGSTDMHLPCAFRHDIRIPDALFPESWKNVDPSKLYHAS